MRKKNFMKKFIPLLLVFIFAFGIFSPSLCSAEEDALGELKAVGAGITGGAPPEADLPTTLGKIIKIILSFMGIVLLVVVLYGGFLWMTAGGEEEKVRKAKDWIINGIIGLVIILLAYAITSYVVKKLTTEIIPGA